MANQKLNAIITIGGAVSGSLRNSLGATQRQLRGIGDTLRNLERDQKGLGRAIGDAAGTQPIFHLQRRYDELGRKIDATRRKQERMTRAIKGMDDGKAMMGAGLTGLTKIGAAAGVATLPLVAAAQFEKAMAGVAKQVDGARDSAGKLTPVYYAMRREIQMLGREIPIPTNKLAEMVEAAARMGIPRDQLIEFTKTTAMMAAAFDDIPADELADQMGKIANLYKVPLPHIRKLADTINYLDDNSLAKGGDIIDFLQRVGGAASSVKITGAQTAALGSTLLSLGERAENASTATNAIFAKFGAAEKGTKKFGNALKEIGIDASDLQKSMQVDAQGAILRVVDAINKMPKDKRLGIMVDLIGLEHADTFAKLANGVGEYRKEIEMAGSSKAVGSMAREAATAASNTVGQFEILKNSVTEVAVNIGDVLLPSVNEAFKAIGVVTGGLADFANAHPVLVKNILLVVGAVGATMGVWRAVTVGIGAVKFALFALRYAAITNPIGLLITAIAVGAVLIYENWEPISAFFKGLWADVTKYAGEAWKWVKDHLASFGIVGLIIANWKPITSFFSGLFSGITAAARSAFEWILGKIDAIGRGWTALKGVFGFGDDGKPAASGGSPRNLPRVPPPPPMATARGRGAGYTDNSTNTWHIVAAPGQSPKDVADEVDKRFTQRRKTSGGSLLYNTGTSF